MGGFEVDPWALHLGAGQLRSDGDDVHGAGSRGERAAGDAHAVCGGGPLATALAGFSAELGSRCRGTGHAVVAAGDRLAANASRYSADDAGAAELLNRTLPGDPW